MSQVLLMIVIFILTTDLVILAISLFFSRDILLRRSPGFCAWVIMLFAAVIFMFVACGLIEDLSAEHSVVPAQLHLVLLLTGALLLTMAMAASIWAMENAKKRSRDMTALIMTVIESGDPSLDEHSKRVAELSVLIYDFLPFRLRWNLSRSDLYYSALLIDIGKLGIPNSIRNKTGKLTKDELKLMQGYPEISVAVLRKLTYFSPILDGILYHREWMDGSGFYHRKGKEIPIASRIIAVANVFSALTTSRPYRPSLSYEAAVEELILNMGTHLDPDIVRCFCEIPLKSVANCLQFDTFSLESISEEIMKK